MKWLLSLAGLLLTVLGGIYVLLFTSTGNKIVAPYIEKQINGAVALETKLERFELGIDSFHILLQLTPKNSIEASGDYSILTQDIQAEYRVMLDDLEALEPLSGQKMYGVLHVDGTVTGTPEHLDFTGQSDIAQSRTAFEGTVLAGTPATLKASIKGARTESLLQMLAQKPILSGALSLDAKLDDLNPASLKGVFSMTLDKGSIDRKTLKRDYGVDIPDSAFDAKADALLEGTKITYDLGVRSALATITSKGNVVPSTMAMNLVYDVAIKELGLFAAMTPVPLHGPLALAGKVTGDQKRLSITGTTDIAKSDSRYDVILENFTPSRVVANVKGGHTEALLKMLGEAPVIAGRFDLDATLNDLNPEHLAGDLVLKLPKGSLDRAILKHDYALELPDTAFSADADAKLKGEDVTYGLNVHSALANVTSGGVIKPKTMAMDLSYDLSLKELGMLKSVTPVPMRGAIATKGSVKGDQKRLNVVGTSDIAGSQSDYRLTLEAFAPRSVTANIKGAEVRRVLAMLSQPHYGDGVIDISVDIPDARMGQLDGTVRTSVTKGLANSELISKQFDFLPMPKTTFSTKTVTTLSKNRATTVSEIRSTLADVTGKKATVDFDTGYVHADYRVDIPDLDKLYFVAERHLKGGIVLTGDMVKEKDLDITAHSETLGGALDVTMHNDDVHVVAKSLQTLDALKMLTYPEIFKSAMNGVADYNVLTQKGQFKADLSDGTFTQNIMLDLLRQGAGMDLYKERFKGTLDGTIVKENVTANLDLRANKSSITGKGMLLNTKTQQVDAKLQVVANNNPVGVKIKGSMNAPKVNLDLSDLAEKEAKKALQKEVNKLFKKLF